MSIRAVLPGGVIAAMLTAAAMLALLVALGIRGEGPLSLGIGDADGSARLEGGGAATLAVPTTGVRETAPGVLPAPGDAVTAATAAPARRAHRGSARRGSADRRPQAGRRPTARIPARRAPSQTTPNAPAASAPAATSRPAPVSTPNPNPVKFRSRGPAAPPRSVVKKERAVPGGGSAAPAPVPTRPVPPPSAPQLNRSAPAAPSPAPAQSPPLTRVPAPTATP